MKLKQNLARSSAVALSFTLLLEQANAQVYNYQSGEQKNQLIELYTSQGCSSCPPAEHLLSTLVQSKQLFKRYFPIALHVDYWNYLGWSDTYSNSHSNQRQQKHFKQSNTSNIYTPQFVVDGNEWRGFFRGAPLPALSKQATGLLKLQVDDTLGVASMRFSRANSWIPSACHFALLAFDPSVKVTAGENSGLKLSQDFAMLEIASSHAEFKNDQFTCNAQLSKLPALAVKPTKNRKYAVVSWMASQLHSPIQVTGGWLDAVKSK